MAQPQKVYPFDIPNIHPGDISAHIVQTLTLHLDQNIVAGDPVNILDTKRAQGVASCLEHLQVSLLCSEYEHILI